MKNKSSHNRFLKYIIFAFLKNRILLTNLFFILFIFNDAIGANSPPPDQTIISQTTTNAKSPFLYVFTSLELWRGLFVLIFGVFVTGIQYSLLKKRNLLSADDILRAFTVPLIVIGTIFVISTGLDNNKVAPAIGLFGTIAGYLLGKHDSKKELKDSKYPEIRPAQITKEKNIAPGTKGKK